MSNLVICAHSFSVDDGSENWPTQDVFLADFRFNIFDQQGEEHGISPSLQIGIDVRFEDGSRRNISAYVDGEEAIRDLICYLESRLRTMKVS